MICKTIRHEAGLRLRTDVRAGGLNGCMRYCDQERGRCFSDPNVPPETCNDRHPVCQNACTVCSLSPS